LGLVDLIIDRRGKEFGERWIHDVSAFLRTANVKNSFVVREFFGAESANSNLFFWLQPKAAISSLRLGGEFPRRGGWG
jgi:hypothetical protein